MKEQSPQWLDELERQVRLHGLDGWLWLVHFGFEGILPDDEDATCTHCYDRLHGLCTRTDGTPFECMKSVVGPLGGRGALDERREVV